METCIQQRQNVVTQYIATQLLLDLCEAAERKQGERVGMWWWEQEGIDLTGSRETMEEAAEADKDGLKD